MGLVAHGIQDYRRRITSSYSSSCSSCYCQEARDHRVDVFDRDDVFYFLYQIGSCCGNTFNTSDLKSLNENVKMPRNILLGCL